MHGKIIALTFLNLNVIHLKKVFLSNLKPIIGQFLDRWGGERGKARRLLTGKQKAAD